MKRILLIARWIKKRQRISNIKVNLFKRFSRKYIYKHKEMNDKNALENSLISKNKYISNLCHWQLIT